MEYLRADDERVEFRVLVAADWEGPRPRQIRHGLTSVDDAVTEWRTSNRAMWPDTELKGVEIDATGPLTTGSVSRGRIEFGVTGAASVEAGHRVLADWFDEAGLDLPPLDAFDPDMVMVDPADGWAIVDDPSKCDRRDVAGQCITDIEGFEIAYTASCKGAYLSFKYEDVDESAPVDATVDVTGALLASNRLLIVDEDEVDDPQEPFGY